MKPTRVLHLLSLGLMLGTLFLGVSIAKAQTVITSYATDFSSTEGQNGWSYRYTTPSGRYGDPLQAAQMAWGGSYWYIGTAGGDRAQINANSLFQRVADDPLAVYTFSADYDSVSIDLNGLTVNANGAGYVGFWDASASTWTTLFTLAAGTTYTSSITLTGIEAGDSIVFGKTANVGTNYGSITNFAPIIYETAAIPESSTSAGFLGLAAIMACLYARFRKARLVP